MGISGRTAGAEAARILARGQPLGHGESHGGSRGAEAWVSVQTQAERECEEVDQSNLPERRLGGCGARLAGERGRAAVERMDQEAAGGGAATAVAKQAGRRTGSCG